MGGHLWVQEQVFCCDWNEFFSSRRTSAFRRISPYQWILVHRDKRNSIVPASCRTSLWKIISSAPQQEQILRKAIPWPSFRNQPAWFPRLSGFVRISSKCFFQSLLVSHNRIISNPCQSVRQTLQSGLRENRLLPEEWKMPPRNWQDGLPYPDWRPHKQSDAPASSFGFNHLGQAFISSATINAVTCRIYLHLVLKPSLSFFTSFNGELDTQASQPQQRDLSSTLSFQQFSLYSVERLYDERAFDEPHPYKIGRDSDATQ